MNIANPLRNEEYNIIQLKAVGFTDFCKTVKVFYSQMIMWNDSSPLITLLKAHMYIYTVSNCRHLCHALSTVLSQ